MSKNKVFTYNGKCKYCGSERFKVEVIRSPRGLGYWCYIICENCMCSVVDFGITKIRAYKNALQLKKMDDEITGCDNCESMCCDGCELYENTETELTNTDLGGGVNVI